MPSQEPEAGMSIASFWTYFWCLERFTFLVDTMINVTQNMIEVELRILEPATDDLGSFFGTQTGCELL